MSLLIRTSSVALRFAIAMLILSNFGVLAAEPTDSDMSNSFNSNVGPFLQKYCLECHTDQNREGNLNLDGYASAGGAGADTAHWSSIVDKLANAQMPPEDSTQPTLEEREAVVAWFRKSREAEAKRQEGDPGVVLARRLSNAEYNYTIRDLTGVDIRPAREFPVDPANTAGFDNSGESLTMSPSLLKKYLQGARDVASHVVLQPKGFHFAPHPMIADTDRDKYCVSRIIDFYHQFNTDFADYFAVAWQYKHHRGENSIESIALSRGLSGKYLNTVWQALEVEKPSVGPLVKLQSMWNAIPETSEGQSTTAEFKKMSDWVVELRKKVEPRFPNISGKELGSAFQPYLMWKNAQYGTHRMSYDPAQLQVVGEDRSKLEPVMELGTENEFGPGATVFLNNLHGDPDLAVPEGKRAEYEAAFGYFCRVFPDRFVMEERGRNYFDTTTDRGRYLNAGFHSLLGFFRDDEPLYELILNEDQQRELDHLWNDMDFVGSATERTYLQFCVQGQRGERSVAQTQRKNMDASARVDLLSESSIQALRDSLLAQAKTDGDPRGIEAINQYFDEKHNALRRTEKERHESEASHLDTLLAFANKAYRRPMSEEEKQSIRQFYDECRASGLTHEDSIREGLVNILMTPDVCYRFEPATASVGLTPLNDYELASRLSYFLWSSIPDAELLQHAAANDLHEPSVMESQVRRMLSDDKVRALAVEFGGSWLDFRRFDEIATVDRNRFPSFTDDLRQAMYEEPIRFLQNIFQSDESVLDCLFAKYTFVNTPLAAHYGMPVADGAKAKWQRVENADQYGRGGLVPMAAFLTKNSPGLRTSPVKRGYWLVKNVLGEHIPAPPPNVPELPQDEAASDLPLRQMLANHRADAGCASCHARFDSFGLVFEGHGPIGDVRQKDLAGRNIDDTAVFPNGDEGRGVAGVIDYIRKERTDDFVDNLCQKLLVYALNRSAILPDDLLVAQMSDNLKANDYRFSAAVVTLVTSPQFLNKRGNANVTQR